jgi:rhamnulokinase
MITRHLAIDLGADSGRVVLGTFDGERFAMEVVHRFPNTPVRVDGLLRWDIEALWAGIITGLQAAQTLAKAPIISLAVDTWGVDYGLLDAAGTLIDQPVHYRDERNLAMPEQVHAVVPKAELFARSGLRGLVFNTIFQLVAEQGQRPQLLQRARRLLTIPDLLAYRLSGVMANEWSNAGTTGLTLAGKPAWDLELMQRLGLPTHLFGNIVASGTVLGTAKAELGFSAPLPVVMAVGGHDTASAVAAMPVLDEGYAFISCGTWSLVGVLNPTPVTSAEAFAGELSNEIAVDGRIRLLKNVMGLWVWQECRRDLIAAGEEFSHAELARLAAEAAPAEVTLDIDRLELLGQSQPHDRMIARIRRQAGELGLAAATPGEVFRRIVEALAAAYQRSRVALERATGKPIMGISLMGGGCHNQLLCQLTADVTGLVVVAGPDEGTALGNLLVQARGLGLVDAAGMARVSAASSTLATYRPRAQGRQTGPHGSHSAVASAVKP